MRLGSPCLDARCFNARQFIRKASPAQDTYNGVRATDCCRWKPYTPADDQGISASWLERTYTNKGAHLHGNEQSHPSRRHRSRGLPAALGPVCYRRAKRLGVGRQTLSNLGQRKSVSLDRDGLRLSKASVQRPRRGLACRWPSISRGPDTWKRRSRSTELAPPSAAVVNCSRCHPRFGLGKAKTLISSRPVRECASTFAWNSVPCGAGYKKACRCSPVTGTGKCCVTLSG